MQFGTAPTQSHQKLKKAQSLKALKAALSNRGPFNMVFSTFQMDHLGRIHQLHWKERLQISKIAKFESDTSQASEVIAQQSCENL